jgi:PKHD-type hydroxylase
MTNYVFAPTPSFGVSEHPFVTWENAFSADELNKIVEYADNLQSQSAVVGSGFDQATKPDVRISNVAWIGSNTETQWMYDRLAYVARHLNGQFYKFDLYGFSEDLQYTIYNGDDESHYTWHVDAGAGTQAPRKLSFVLQLSEPEDYEGGDLELFTESTPVQVTKKRGLIAAFPSYTLHRVTPVTSGIRKTIVVWTCGPAFK